MIRFIHTADWQIGMKASGIGPAGQRVRDMRLSAIKRLLDLSEARQVDLLLITGDVFEDNAVDRLLVRKVGELLSAYKGSVYITPGNHDPLAPGSVWEHPVWRESSNVTVIREPEPLELDDCVLYPCPLKEKYSTRNPTAWIQAHGSSKIAIGLAHGNVEGLPDSDPDYPIPRDAAQRTGLDYLAIGHWHSYASYPDSSGVCRMAYSGTHETTKFGERDSGNILLVEIAARGAAPVIEAIPTGELTWRTLAAKLEQAGGLGQVLAQLDEIDKPDTTLLRIRLSGLLFSSDRADLTALQEIVSTRFLYGVLEIADLIPAPEDDSWIETIPDGPVRAAAEKLRDQAVNGRAERERAIATQALIQLFELQEAAAK